MDKERKSKLNNVAWLQRACSSVSQYAHATTDVAIQAKQSKTLCSYAPLVVARICIIDYRRQIDCLNNINNHQTHKTPFVCLCVLKPLRRCCYFYGDLYWFSCIQELRLHLPSTIRLPSVFNIVANTKTLYDYCITHPVLISYPFLEVIVGLLMVFVSVKCMLIVRNR